jgi:hypothetical protein
VHRVCCMGRWQTDLRLAPSCQWHLKNRWALRRLPKRCRNDAERISSRTFRRNNARRVGSSRARCLFPLRRRLAGRRLRNRGRCRSALRWLRRPRGLSRAFRCQAAAHLGTLLTNSLPVRTSRTALGPNHRNGAKYGFRSKWYRVQTTSQAGSGRSLRLAWHIRSMG